MFKFDEETKWILGQPNFVCGSQARILRLMGHEIEEKAEAEQAAVIYYYLKLWENHGVGWRDVASGEMRAAIDAHRDRLATEREEQGG